MMRKQIVAGNWKMNTNLNSALELTNAIIDQSQKGKTTVILGVPYPFIHPVNDLVSDLSYISIAAQNMHDQDHGAYTGEISADMLTSIGAQYVILGHSERRAYFHENDPLLLTKINKAFENNLSVIYCCGEVLEDRKASNHKEVVSRQLSESVCKLDPESMKNLIIAYEPVWAIGTGETASPEQAQEMHAVIRDILRDTFGDEIAESTSILYGGSVKPSNAEELFSASDVDGGLVGGASLKADSFVGIIHAMEKTLLQ